MDKQPDMQISTRSAESYSMAAGTVTGEHTRENSDSYHLAGDRDKLAAEQGDGGRWLALVADGVSGRSWEREHLTGRFAARFVLENITTKPPFSSHSGGFGPAVPLSEFVRSPGDLVDKSIADVIGWVVGRYGSSGSSATEMLRRRMITSNLRTFASDPVRGLLASEFRREPAPVLFVSVILGDREWPEGGGAWGELADIQLPGGDTFGAHLTDDGPDWDGLAEPFYAFLNDHSGTDLVDIFLNGVNRDPVFGLADTLNRAVESLAEEFDATFRSKMPSELESGRRGLAPHAATTLAAIVEHRDEFVIFAVGDSFSFAVGDGDRPLAMTRPRKIRHKFLAAYLEEDAADARLAQHLSVRKVDRSEARGLVSVSDGALLPGHKMAGLPEHVATVQASLGNPEQAVEGILQSALDAELPDGSPDDKTAAIVMKKS